MKLYSRDSNIKFYIGLSSSMFACLLILILLVSISMMAIASEQEEMKKIIQIINPRPDFSLSLRLDKGVGATYEPGERIRIFFRTDKNSYVTLFGYNTHGNIQLLFPNQNQKNQFVEANREYNIDGMIEQDTLPGLEYIQGFATTEPVIISGELERMLEDEFLPGFEEEISRFIQRLRGILTSLPPQGWVSSEIVHYQVVERRPNTGQLSINSFPEGAEVYLDNRYVGKTPLDIDQVGIGEYVVRVELSGYKTWSRTIQINDNQTTFVSADLQGTQQYGSIAIGCNKDIARIYLNEQFKRITDKDKNIILEQITEGFHDIRITLKGYHDWSQRIDVKPAQRVQLTVKLEKIARTGTLEIICDVDDAMIYLDGNYQRRTSANRIVTISNIQEGSYELQIIKEGYQDFASTVRIYPDRISRVDIQIQQEFQEGANGAIAIYCNVNNARIFIDGIFIETTFADQAKILDELEESLYEITVIKDGYQIWQEEVYVFPGETTSIFADLVKNTNIKVN